MDDKVDRNVEVIIRIRPLIEKETRRLALESEVIFINYRIIQLR